MPSRGDRLLEAGLLHRRTAEDAAVGARDEITLRREDDATDELRASLEHDHLAAHRAHGARRQAAALDEAGPRAGGEQHRPGGKAPGDVVDAGDPPVLDRDARAPAR